MDIDTQFPNLSSFVRSNARRTLAQYGARAEPKNDDYLSLESSCWAVLNNERKWTGGPHQTLKTLDVFIGRLPRKTSKRSIWHRISAKGSQFLDTVVEVSWALHFWENGDDATLEQPLDPSNPSGKNADMVVTLNGTKHWLDATSVQLSTERFPMPTTKHPDAQMRPSVEVLEKLAEKARAKYEEKFGNAVRAGLLRNGIAGVLLCVLKSEGEVFRAFNYCRLPPPAPPQGLLDDERPGLNVVWVHTLRTFPDSDILRPCLLAKWQTT